MEKKELRELMNSWRISQSDELISTQSKEIGRHLLKYLDDIYSQKFFSDYSVKRSSPTIGLYNAFRNEVDLSCIWKDLLHREFRLAFPKIINSDCNNQNFSEYTKRDSEMVFVVAPENADKLANWFKPGLFGVMEPPLEENTELANPDIIILPGLAFDRAKNRLGWGKGFYDQYLAICKNKPLALAAALSDQVIDFVPHDDNDQPADGIITPDGLLW